MHHTSNSTPQREKTLRQQSTMRLKKYLCSQEKTAASLKETTNPKNTLQQTSFICPQTTVLHTVRTHTKEVESQTTVLHPKTTHYLKETGNQKVLFKNAVKEKTVHPKISCKNTVLAQGVTIKKTPQQKPVRQKTMIRRISVAELFSNEHCLALHDEYMHECALAKLPNPEEKIASYKALEASGSDVFSLYGAFAEEELVGFLILLTPVIPHYGTAIAVAESLFVAAKHRSSGAGLLLIRKAEQRAKELGSQGLLFSSPTGGRLATVLPRIGYRETNRVFFKETF